jgi:hypothetical protein
MRHTGYSIGFYDGCRGAVGAGRSLYKRRYAGDTSRMKHPVTERDNFIWLLIALVTLLFTDALFAQLGTLEGQRYVNLMLMVTIVAAVWAVDYGQGKRLLNWKLGMSFIIIGLMVGDSLLLDNRLALFQLCSSFLFLSFTLHLCWRQVIFSGVVDGNKIVGAICIYILIGLIWAFAYLIVEQVFPGSFSGLDNGPWQLNLDTFIYYSMVTLTTLGYGDITPQLPLARFLAFMEAITGVFYTTILVASLIGMRLAHYSEKLARQIYKDRDE